MKLKTNIKLDLTTEEKQLLRRNKLRMADIAGCPVKELVALGIPPQRAKVLHALAEFQIVSSVGIRFAEDLISLGYYSLKELKGKNGAKLVEAFERHKGYWIDPCVEDQFRLVVHVANTGDLSRSWWDFTEERKAYRLKKGYPANRPEKAWYEIPGYK